MKKLILFFLIFSFSSLLANDKLDDFIDTQIKVEAKFLDMNLTLDEKVDIKKQQSRDFQEFFLQYAASKNKDAAHTNHYTNEIRKLKLRLRNNQHRGNTNAALRDEVLLQGYTIRNGIRSTLIDVLQYTDSESKAFFKDKIGEVLVQNFSSYKPLDRKKYISEDQNISSPVVKSLHEAFRNNTYLESVANTSSSELVENSSIIYRTASLSKSRLFTFVNSINKSSFGQKLNSYLTPFNLDSARVIIILMIIILIVIMQMIIRFITNRFLARHKLKEDDINYIHSHITKIFNVITSLLIIHLILVVFIGVDSKSINISRVFSVFYVILTALLLYRITNTIAYLKMENIKKSATLKNEVVNLTIKVINGLIILIAVIAILKIIGIDLTTLLSGLGIAGAAVAFAAKDSIANIFGSISILAGDVFEQGDWIESKGVDGTVVEIGLRATTVRTFDNALISVPNFELSNNSVKNWSRRSIGRRIKMNIGVTYESDFNDIKQAIEDIKEMLKNHPGIANEHTSYLNPTRQARLVSIEDFKGIKRTTLVYLDEFSDSSINILLYCFSRTVDWNEWLEIKEDVMFKIAGILKKNHLEFAYPTLTLHQAEKEDMKEN